MNILTQKNIMLALFIPKTYLIVAIAVGCALLIGAIITLGVFLKKRKAKKRLLSEQGEDKSAIDKFTDNAKTEDDEQTVSVVSTIVDETPVLNQSEVADDGNKDKTVLSIRKTSSNLGIISRYERSFLAKLIQSDEQCKKYYSILKNSFLSFKKVSSRVSWNYDSINYGRVQLAKFTVRGKTLNLHLALDPVSLDGTKYKVENNTGKRYQDVPCQFKITSDRRVKYALELIALVADTYSVETGKVSKENFEMPFESTESLVQKGLIKELISKEQYDRLLSQRGDSEDAELEQFRGVEKGTGLAIVARYRKSFLARLIQASDQTKQYYSTLKNALLSYKKTTSRISWNYDSINLGRVQLVKFNVRGKTLNVYFALDYQKYEDSKYKVENNTAKCYSDVPCQYKITSDRRLKYALELIVDLAERFALKNGEQKNDNYAVPYESTETLIQKELIKELISKENYEEFMRRRSMDIINKKHREFVSAAEVDAIISDEVASAVITVVHDSSDSTAKKGIINIDTLSANFRAGEKVTIEKLKEKNLIEKSIGYVKVLARGTLDKPLIVELQSYSIQAVKMIVLTGGKVEKF